MFPTFFYVIILNSQFLCTFLLGELRLHLGKTQKYLVFHSICTNFAPRNKRL